MNQLLGCDESHYQSTFVEKSFVICKCSEGFAATDDTYASKKAQARTDGIVFGSYHFADGEDAIEEAKHFLASVGEILEGDLLALDAETGQTAAWCQQFLSYVEAQVGFKPFLYAPVGGWSTALDYPLWVARYGANNGNINLNMPPNIGQWGTSPGQNFIYIHLNRIIKENDADIIYISGPGHGGPSLNACSYLEGSYTEVHPEITHVRRSGRVLRRSRREVPLHAFRNRNARAGKDSP